MLLRGLIKSCFDIVIPIVSMVNFFLFCCQASWQLLKIKIILYLLFWIIIIARRRRGCFCDFARLPASANMGRIGCGRYDNGWHYWDGRRFNAALVAVKNAFAAWCSRIQICSSIGIRNKHQTPTTNNKDNQHQQTTTNENNKQQYHNNNNTATTPTTTTTTKARLVHLI